MTTTSAAAPKSSPGSPPAEGMRWIPGGTFAMGSEGFYPEERPVHRVSVDGFWMDEKPVTAAEFRRFVRETKYVTVAERPLDPEQYPDDVAPRLPLHRPPTSERGSSGRLKAGRSSFTTG